MCSFVYQGTLLSPLSYIDRAIRAMNEFMSALFPLHPPLDIPPAHWTPPADTIIKNNCDAACDQSTFKAGLGVVSRDHFGVCLQGTTTTTAI